MVENKDLVVSKSKEIGGQLGVVAKRDFNKGDLLFKVIGPLLTERTKYSFPVDLNLHIDPVLENGEGDFGYYTNHSCDPNAFVSIIKRESEDPYIEIIARKDIKSGEEVTIDYSSFEYETVAEGESCNCGQESCRGKISGFKNLPTDIKEKYKNEDIIPDYLIRLDLQN